MNIIIPIIRISSLIYITLKVKLFNFTTSALNYKLKDTTGVTKIL